MATDVYMYIYDLYMGPVWYKKGHNRILIMIFNKLLGNRNLKNEISEWNQNRYYLKQSIMSA